MLKCDCRVEFFCSIIYLTDAEDWIIMNDVF